MIGMILAGGSGTRLWPYSRSMSPKQFLNLGSTHESLLQETYRRIHLIAEPHDIYLIGAKAHEHELHQQLAQLDREFQEHQLLLEPMSRNTAPAILWGLFQLPESQWDEPIVILPADHLIRAQDRFIEAIHSAKTLVTEGWLVIFGVRPDKPDTGYGYIKAGDPLKNGFRVAQFEEKPDRSTAERYIASPHYTWNAGIFMATARMLLEEFETHTPALFSMFHSAKIEGADFLNPDTIETLYGSVVAESFDYAILEKSAAIAVMPVDMEWSDLGSWESIYQVSQKDQHGNVIQGHVISQDTQNCLIFSSKKLVTSIGAKNLLIVETDDALLVCDLSRSQEVKQLVETLREKDRYEYQFHTTVLRPWGKATILSEAPDYKLKMLEIQPGRHLSLQLHRHRSEHWVVLEGTADVKRGDETLLVHENESIHIPPTIAHRLGNSGKVPLRIIEVQQGTYLGDDDIERLEHH